MLGANVKKKQIINHKIHFKVQPVVNFYLKKYKIYQITED